MNNIFSSRYTLLNWFLSNKSQILLNEGPHRIEFFAKHISYLFNNFPYEIKENKKILLETKPFDLKKIDHQEINSFFSEIISEVLNINEFINFFSVHGSYSDNSFKIGWSDVDTFCIINKHSCEDYKALLKIRDSCLNIENLFLKICPLQHHGVITISENDLDFYDSHFLPIQVIESSKHIFRKNSPILYWPNKKTSGAYYSLIDRYEHMLQAEKTGFYMHHPFENKGLPTDHDKLENHLYQLFCYLGYVMTMPAYFLDAIDKPTTKENSFIKIKEYFKESELEIIQLASKIRNEWPLKNSNNYHLNDIPKWVIELLPVDYFQKTKKLLEIFINTIKTLKK